jgi:hypothetical protein
MAPEKTLLTTQTVETVERRFPKGSAVAPDDFSEQDYQYLLSIGALQPLNIVHITSGDTGVSKEDRQ